ncbi:MAG: helix-turn-helix transcriptional regulator [Symploca sp. SIO3C6]|uniref:Helix-turn-helix transcriptional regulator n=1 Tax=Symploca sp. SIO1C4 TaxID=2607765 RepID=A0A6B3NKC1_9CYAN|nr:helix-turn-helix transcriptional regulator [Symploca sp. SIO3C6]NER30574.1 helix-turn-helix transcriptional regulator [Symploca sp. SIO1C4]NET05851.1 helix-turn-helix transcriptional regulator [Symploca sp. SIO2B6]
MRSKAANTNKVSCPVENTLKVIGGRWKVLILRELFQGVKRFGQLHRALEGITQKMLTQQLREMEADGIVNREVYLQVPPKVEYSLTPLGKSLKPVIDSMHEWGIRLFSRQLQRQEPISNTLLEESPELSK